MFTGFDLLSFLFGFFSIFIILGIVFAGFVLMSIFRIAFQEAKEKHENT